jgi:hypothetical protein
LFLQNIPISLRWLDDSLAPNIFIDLKSFGILNIFHSKSVPIYALLLKDMLNWFRYRFRHYVWELYDVYEYWNHTHN